MCVLKLPILNIELRMLPYAIGFYGAIASIFTNIETISMGGKGKNGSSIAVSHTFFVKLQFQIIRQRNH